MPMTPGAAPSGTATGVHALEKHDVLHNAGRFDADGVAIRIDAVGQDDPADAAVALRDGALDRGTLCVGKLQCRDRGGDSRGVEPGRPA